MVSYRDCLSAAAEFLRLDSVAGALRGGTQDELNESDKADLELLIFCAGFVTDEIAAEYVPLYRTETVAIKDGKIRVSALSEAVTDIVSVSVDGAKRRFGVLRDEIVLGEKKSGSASVTYCTVPQKVQLDGFLPWPGDTVSARIVGYGVACEYCIVNGMSEATLWDKRYKDALAAMRRTKREVRVKQRRWI